MAAPAAADKPTAAFTIEHEARWPDQLRPVKVRAGIGPWRTAKPNGDAGPFSIKLGSSAAVMFEVRTGAKGRAIRRLAAIVPGTTYRVTANACAFWGLDVTDPPADPDAELPPERVRVDASALPASAFPIEIGVDLEDTIALDKPGISAPLELAVSAMCPRSGTGVVVKSRGKTIFDETLIPHPGRLHTLRFRKRSSYELVVEP
jgi:hypothetical protein